MDIQEERKNILLQEGEIHNQTHYLDVKIQLIGKAIIGVAVRINLLEKANTIMFFK